MVRDASHRKRKYEAKVDAETLATQTRALKPMMIEGEAKYFGAIAPIESNVKKLVEAEGVSSLQVRDYINFGREMYELTQKFSGSTLAGEAQLKVNKWSDRGLTGSLLVKVAGLFGVKPTAPPTPPVAPPKTLLGFCGIAQTGSVTRFYRFNQPVAQTSESFAQLPMNVGCFKHLKIYVLTNTHIDVSTFRVRVKGADTSLLVNVPALTTGIFTVSADALVNENDMACLGVTTRSVYSTTFLWSVLMELW